MVGGKGGEVTCEACGQLWKKYEEAVFEHVRVSSRHKLAEAAGDQAGVEKMESEMAGALEKRTVAREALLAHERESGHGQRID